MISQTEGFGFSIFYRYIFVGVLYKPIGREPYKLILYKENPLLAKFLEYHFSRSVFLNIKIVANNANRTTF